MIEVSERYEKIPEELRIYHANVQAKLTDGTILTIGDDDLMAGGLSIETATSQSGSFDLGGMVIGKLSMRVTNAEDRFTPHDFTGAEMSPKIGLELSEDHKGHDGGTLEDRASGDWLDGGALSDYGSGDSYDDGLFTDWELTKVEWLDKGVFTAERAATSGSVWTITAYDDMAKLDQDYGKSELTYPATFRQIAQDACNVCGLVLSPDRFAGEDRVFEKRPEGENLTFRAVLSYAAQITGNYGCCDGQGRLSFRWYDIDALRNPGFDGGTFDRYDPSLYTTGDDLDGGDFFNYSGEDVHDEGSFSEWPEEWQIHDFASFDADLWDVQITGVKAEAKETVALSTVNAEGETETVEEERSASHLFGEEGYVLTIENNPLVSCDEVKEAAELAGSRIVGSRFRPLDVTVQSDPRVEAGDLATVTDHKGLTYRTVLTNVTYTLGGNGKHGCGAVSATEQAAPRPSVTDQKIEQAKKGTEAQIRNQKTEVQRMTGLIAKSMGIFQTAVRQEDGSAVFYMHDKPKLEDSRTLWRMSAGVFSVSTDGGKTWNAGMDSDGNAVVNMLSAIGINFDWARGGTLTLGGRSNANGTFSLLANDDREMIRMDHEGIKLANGASLMSASGVCGNLQFVSNGGRPEMLGGILGNTDMVMENPLVVCAYVPAAYVVQEATLRLISAPGHWTAAVEHGEDYELVEVVGHSRKIKLCYSLSDATIGLVGRPYDYYHPGSQGVWNLVSGAAGGEFSSMPDGAASGSRTIVSGNLARLLIPGQVNLFKVESQAYAADYDESKAFAHVGTGIAVLDVIGYTKN